MKLEKNFFLVDGITLAKNLLGKVLVRKIDNKILKARIVETEAYMGPLDKAAHSYQNRRTKRTEAMFLEGGHIYIYLIYGMYYCFNISANKKDIPEAVLIRAVEPLKNIEYMKQLRNIKKDKDLSNGPGKLAKALSIDKTFNTLDITKNNYIWLENDDYSISSITQAKRIGIDYAEEYKDKLWRFYIPESKYVSVKL
ncbi:3-methyladenine DNA glycosylase [Fusobacterium necrogenes]|uniref:Putative 3-methyladenine DNA glycosylase n=1 Tax=Fusobacterium necrogenes TaxID=858 RepID=A0A377GV84_9FUSO|nr:DNA-3-methyladenine glycosylase [Fusobacterium necrogenes]STO30856.1 3-methyladenine DNA glycosylase [Fusobacterium necrogenes]